MLEIKNVSKSFAKVKALDDVSFVVEKGDLLVLLGKMEQVNLRYLGV